MTMIATVGVDIPQDVMAATGRYAGPLDWNIERAFPRAAQWLESKFPPWAYSIMEDWAAGTFDHLDAVVFSRGEDSGHRLYYYATELRRRKIIGGPEPLVFDIARIARPTSEAHNITSVRQLATALGLSDAVLERGIRETNIRRAAPAAESSHGGSVCLLAGSAPPDRRVHGVIEKAGWSAVGETLSDAWRRLGAPVAEGTGDPAAAIGRQVYAEQIGPRGFFDRGDALLAQAKACGATAVVLWYIEEDEAQIWHLPHLRDVLKSAGMPALVLTRCDWRMTDGADAKIAAFLKDVRR